MGRRSASLSAKRTTYQKPRPIRPTFEELESRGIAADVIWAGFALTGLAEGSMLAQLLMPLPRANSASPAHASPLGGNDLRSPGADASPAGAIAPHELAAVAPPEQPAAAERGVSPPVPANGAWEGGQRLYADLDHDGLGLLMLDPHRPPSASSAGTPQLGGGPHGGGGSPEVPAAPPRQGSGGPETQAMGYDLSPGPSTGPGYGTGSGSSGDSLPPWRFGNAPAPSQVPVIGTAAHQAIPAGTGVQPLHGLLPAVAPVSGASVVPRTGSSLAGPADGPQSPGDGFPISVRR